MTIFTTPRPFQGPFDILQRNAIKSWMELSPKCEIILCNDEEGTTAKVAKEFGLLCISDITCTEFGTPLMSDVFSKVQKIAKNDVLAQVNTDVILTNDFLEAIQKVKQLMGNRPFYMIGRRWDLDVKELINFNETDWEKKLHKRVRKEGKLHGFTGMDYWVFPRNLPFNLPPFAVGRPGMDTWLVYKAKSLKIPVVDATEAITIIHQNHNYPRKNNSFFEIEKQRNLKLAGGFTVAMTIRNADFVLTKEGLKRPKLSRRIFTQLSLFYPLRVLLAMRRKLRQLFKFLQ